MKDTRIVAHKEASVNSTGWKELAPKPLRRAYSRLRRWVKPQADGAAVAPFQHHAAGSAVGDTNAQYWSSHNVTLHAKYPTVEESINDFHWRNAQYYPYLDLMPVSGQDDKIVLDYGCGPGYDLVGFAHYSKPKRLIGADISPVSLAEAKSRVSLHGIEPELHRIVEGDNRIPLPDASVDYVHSSGVIHHTADPQTVLRELRRVVRSDGSARIMVYNYESLWLHLYTAYVKMIEEAAIHRAQQTMDPFAGLNVRQAFAKLTDGLDCPISRAYKPDEFCALAVSAGWHCRFEGAAVSMWEMGLLPKRFDAVRNPQLPAEHREFLLALEIDANGFAKYQGHFAGVDGCYRLTPAV